MYDVPPTGERIRLRGLRAEVVLDEFAPTHLDAWYATAHLPAGPVPAVVVRHSGDVQRRGLLGRGSDPPPPPSPDAVLGLVVEPRGTTAVWLPPKDRAALARDLSRADWRAFTDIG